MGRARLINRRRQGDLGEASAIEWLTSKGALVFFPLGHSPDVDLIAELDGRLLRVQVKTTTYQTRTSKTRVRWNALIATNGGNQSWSGLTKLFDPNAVDYLFVLVGDGRRWFIPAGAVEATRCLSLGGVKYSECEIEPGKPILDAVYGASPDGSTLDDRQQGELRRWRTERACKVRGLSLSGFESHLPHQAASSAKDERKLGRAGQAIVRGKRQMTIPARPYNEAGLEAGDRVRFRADGPGRIVLERIEPDSNTLAGDDGAHRADGNGAGPTLFG